MRRFRDHMRIGNRKLHEHMSFRALCFMPPFVDGTTEVTEIDVRKHDKFVQLGDLKGTNFNYAEIEDNSPRLVFERSQIEPVRNHIVSVAVGEAYRVDTVLPPDDEFVTARVARLHPSEAAGLPVPE